MINAAKTEEKARVIPKNNSPKNSKARSPAGIIRIDKKHVHKKRIENVLVSSVIQLMKEEKRIFLGQIALDQEHAFFFEHEYDHVPGLFIMEAARQFATAAAHLYFDVPYDSHFILDTIESKFMQYADLNKPLFIKSSHPTTVYRKARLRKMWLEVEIIQEGTVVAKISGSWRMIDDKIMRRLREAQRVSEAIPA